MNYLTMYFSNKHISEPQNCAFVFPLKNSINFVFYNLSEIQNSIKKDFSLNLEYLTGTLFNYLIQLDFQ